MSHYTCIYCGGEHVIKPDFCTYCNKYLLSELAPIAPKAKGKDK